MDLDQAVRNRIPSIWINPDVCTENSLSEHGREPITERDFKKACRCWAEMQPLFCDVFPALGTGTRIDSLLKPIGYSIAECDVYHALLKHDHRLPIAGSIKARGGFFEVVSHAIDLAKASGAMMEKDPITSLTKPDIKHLLGSHTIRVASTGNLGVSVALISRALGFQVDVFVSREAKAWKVAYLKGLGVNVHQVAGDYTSGLVAAQEAHDSNPVSYFVDDERSTRLFLGYSAAGPELAIQLKALGYDIGATQPLFVYIPCGIGGAPAGIAYGLKQIFGDSVHCFFVEPVAYPCMMIEMSTPRDVHPDISDYGINDRSEADGLAVGRASRLASTMMRHRLSGIFTLDDQEMLTDLYRMAKLGKQQLEPSAAAGLSGPRRLLESPQGKAYLAEHGLADHLENAVHVVWATGGSLVPAADHNKWFSAGQQYEEGVVE